LEPKNELRPDAVRDVPESAGGRLHHCILRRRRQTLPWTRSSVSRLRHPAWRSMQRRAEP
jgi:hypothetical protein